MTRHLCPKCMEILMDDLSCYFCKGYYTWVEGKQENTIQEQIKQSVKEPKTEVSND